MYSYHTYTGDGATTDFAVTFPYLEQAHVEVSVAGESIAHEWASAGVVRISPAPAIGAEIVIRRNTSRAARIVDFQDSASLTEDTLDRSATQLFYMVQEAFDQETAGASFDTDAAGARITNVGSPLSNTDAATKGWVQDYIDSLDLGGGGGGGGLDLRPLDNTWTGVNNFENLVGIGAATFDSVDVVTRDLLALDKGLNIVNQSNLAARPGYGLVVQMRRSSGYALGWGASITALGASTWAGPLLGSTSGIWRGRDSTGECGAFLAAVVSTNPSDSTSRKYGLDLRFMNREDGSATGGDSPTVISQAGYGTGANYYNANSWAIQFTGQGRSDAGATYVGWNRGLRFFEDWADIAKPAAYSAATAYKAGDYVAYSGSVYLCLLACTGVTPVAGAYWANYGPTSTVGAVGIDFAGVGSTTASRMLGAIRLRGDMPILWDSEGFVQTSYSAVTGLWSMNYGYADRSLAPEKRLAIDITTGDILIQNSRRVLATRSSVSAHRNYGVTLLPASTWTQVICGTKERDDRTEYNTGTGRFTPNTPGDYLVVWQVQTEAAPAAGHRLYAGVGLNGSIYKAAEVLTGSGTATATCSCIVRLNGLGDYVTTHALTSDPSVLSLTGEPSGTFLQISKVQ